MKRKLTPQFFQSVLNDLKKEIQNKTLQTTPFCNRHRVPYIVVTTIRKLGYFTKTSAGEFLWISGQPTEKDGLRVKKAFLKYRKPADKKHSKKKAKKVVKLKTVKEPKTSVLKQDKPKDAKYLSFITKMLEKQSKEELIALLLTYI